MKKEVIKTSLYGLLIPLNDTWFLDIVKVNIVKRDESLIKPAIEQAMFSPTRPYASKPAQPARMIKIGLSKPLRSFCLYGGKKQTLATMEKFRRFR